MKTNLLVLESQRQSVVWEYKPKLERPFWDVSLDFYRRFLNPYRFNRDETWFKAFVEANDESSTQRVTHNDPNISLHRKQLPGESLYPAPSSYVVPQPITSLQFWQLVIRSDI